MSNPLVLATTTPGNENVKSEVFRPLAGFHPSIWGDKFIHYTPEDMAGHVPEQQQMIDLKEEVRRELIASGSEHSQKLNLIEAVQRLGVAYHFQEEIEEALKLIYVSYQDHDDEDNLRTLALRFRLLRQAGLNISCDTFNKFKDDTGDFKECLVSDIDGMLALYEATHLMKHGEAILEEALNFTTAHLSSMVTRLSKPLAEQVRYALKQPNHKGIPRLEARRYISIYQQKDAHDEALLKFAKLDFNFLQSVHKMELADITRWWKGLDFKSKLPFARDRIVEGYFWILGVYYEPQYFLARRILTKVLAMSSTIDDIYDAYGTIDELELFTIAIERWDFSSSYQLPEYMKICYKALLDVYKEIEEEMTKQGQLYRVYYAKAAMKKFVKAYFVEAKWLQEKHVPTMEEYMQNALVSSGYYMLTATSFVGMGEIVTEGAFDWVFNDPKIVTAAATINRLMSDIVSHKFEQKRAHVASAIECYMKQNHIPEQQIYKEFNKQITSAWKDINQEYLRPTIVPMPLLERVLNLARVMDVVYKDEDGYTHVGPEMKERIVSLLIDPMPL